VRKNTISLRIVLFISNHGSGKRRFMAWGTGGERSERFGIRGCEGATQHQQREAVDVPNLVLITSQRPVRAYLIPLMYHELRYAEESVPYNIIFLRIGQAESHDVIPQRSRQRALARVFRVYCSETVDTQPSKAG
jgi:hypothetical protein